MFDLNVHIDHRDLLGSGKLKSRNITKLSRVEEKWRQA